MAASSEDKPAPLSADSPSYDYDLVVIGGGSGGMACAKQAASFGARVVLFDYVQPTQHNTKWGLGGTCVNVGCIPKKLMHYAAICGKIVKHDAHHLGWTHTIPKKTGPQKTDDEDDKHMIGVNGEEINGEGKTKSPEEPSLFDWNKLVSTVQKHIKSLNFSYRTSLRSNKVTYINAQATLTSKHHVTYTLKSQETTISTQYILIATGGRPHIPNDIEGAKELCYTSDDLFSLKKPPGKTLIVGASYIALECAGFLTELGYDVTVCVRSILLRGFDRQCAQKVGVLMSELGTKFMYEKTPRSFTKCEGEGVSVRFSDGEIYTYDTVLYATGRIAQTEQLNLVGVGVKTTPNLKIDTSNEQTNVENIYAVGDVLYAKPELTPVAIKAGELLANRLFGGSTHTMNYTHIPTTVFTPFEYGCVGYTEEEAIDKYGLENVEVYLSEFSTLEIAALHREKAISQRNDEFDTQLSPNCLSKLICAKKIAHDVHTSSDGGVHTPDGGVHTPDGGVHTPSGGVHTPNGGADAGSGLEKSKGADSVKVEKNMQEEYVVGFHFVGPNAGEITQGMAIALRLGAKKSDFDETVGIHPTDAESFTQLSITKSSGLSWVATGGCGGGKCG